MPFTPKILAFAGSTRSGSFNKKLIDFAADAAGKSGADVTLIDLRDYPIPLYDADLEAADGIPENARKLKELFNGQHGFLIASPEYNSTITPLMKNVIDWLTRPIEGEKSYASFEGKVAGIMSASPGALGGLRSLAQLRALLENIRLIVLPDQQAISSAHKAFDDDGALNDPKQRKSVEAIASKLTAMLIKLHA